MAFLCHDSLPSPSQAERQLTPRERHLVTSSHAHSLPIQCHILTAVSWPLRSPRRSFFKWTIALFYDAGESEWEQCSWPSLCCLCYKQDRLAKENGEATYIKVLTSLPGRLITLPAETRDYLDSVRVWSPDHKRQHHLRLARNAKPQALPQTYWIRTLGAGPRNLCSYKPSRWFSCLLTVENHCPR